MRDGRGFKQQQRLHQQASLLINIKTFVPFIEERRIVMWIRWYWWARQLSEKSFRSRQCLHSFNFQQSYAQSYEIYVCPIVRKNCTTYMYVYMYIFITQSLVFCIGINFPPYLILKVWTTYNANVQWRKFFVIQLFQKIILKTGRNIDHECAAWI